jgi:hypothetical protein
MTIRTWIERCAGIGCVLSLVLLAGCGSSSGGGGSGGTGGSGGSADEGSGSEVAVSVVSGALNNTIGTMVGWNRAPAPKRSIFRTLLDGLAPIRTAFAATWSCTGGTLSPTYGGPSQDPYTFTPMSCTVTWGPDRHATSTWSGTFTLDYGASCDSTHAFIGGQTADCSLTRTTSTDGNTRSITGPNGNAYAIKHDTHGTGTGWDAAVSPAPTDDGIVTTCGASGCAGGRSLAIHGSHLTGSIEPVGGSAVRIWDHTVSTGTTGITVTGSDTSRVVSGQVTVQHNLLRFTATTTFNNVAYGDASCCFPTGGSVTTTVTRGLDAGRTETLAFDGASCGSATLTPGNGSPVAITLQHCI